MGYGFLIIPASKAPVLQQLPDDRLKFLFAKRPPLKLVVQHLQKMSEGAKRGPQMGRSWWIFSHEWPWSGKMLRKHQLLGHPIFRQTHLVAIPQMCGEHQRLEKGQLLRVASAALAAKLAPCNIVAGLFGTHFFVLSIRVYSSVERHYCTWTPAVYYEVGIFMVKSHSCNCAGYSNDKVPGQDRPEFLRTYEPLSLIICWGSSSVGTCQS